MSSVAVLIKALPFLAVGVFAADYPAIPSDLTTPVQQRLAVKGLNCMSPGISMAICAEANVMQLFQ
jgi:acid phosphatase type 7